MARTTVCTITAYDSFTHFYYRPSTILRLHTTKPAGFPYITTETTFLIHRSRTSPFSTHGRACAIEDRDDADRCGSSNNKKGNAVLVGGPGGGPWNIGGVFIIGGFCFLKLLPRLAQKQPHPAAIHWDNYSFLYFPLSLLLICPNLEARF